MIFHKTITILFLATAAMIIFQLAFKVSPIYMGGYLVAQVGSAIGINVSVPPNPFNTLAEQLKNKEISLLERERELAQREKQLKENNQSGAVSANNNLILLLTVAGALFALILTNFYLDWRRRNNNLEINK